MPSLVDKVTQLKTDADIAARLAAFWQKQIAEHGEDKATAFYKSLGLNHLDNNSVIINEDSKRTIEVNVHSDPGSAFKAAALFGETAGRVFIPARHQAKGVEWEGLTLSREPTEAEKLCVKGIHGAQEAGKASVTTILLKLRTTLIDDALKAIKKLKPAIYHELILKTPKESRTELRDELVKVFLKGKKLVALELRQQGGKASDYSVAYKDLKQSDPTEEDDEELDDLTDLTDSRVVNDVQSRLTASAARYALMGIAGAALIEAVRKEMADGSVSYIERAATGVSNKVLSFGRGREMEDRADEIGHYEYSALLDQNTCPSCSADDGKEANTPDDLPDAPNPDCDGSDFCRCFVVAVAD